MRAVAKLCAFILLIIGTLGLLINELIFDWGSAATVTFAGFNVGGFVLLAFMHWGIGKKKPEA